MDPSNSRVENWMRRFESGDETAAEEIVEAFYQRLVGLARRRLAPMPSQIADDEGAVVSALRSFFSGIDNGQIRALKTESDLWRILATITARKAIGQLRTHWKQSGAGSHPIEAKEVESLLSHEPTPEDQLIVEEEFRLRLASLDDPVLQQIARLCLDGWSLREIAERLAIHLRSVQRKIRLIEAKWLDSVGEN